MDIIKASKPASSPGVYQITNVICKELKDILAPILCKIFNKALAERKPVYEIINVIVTLLFKGGSRMELTQYRPVSLLPTFIRIFDKCLFSRLDEFIERNTLLSERQYGRRRGRNPIALVQDLMFKSLEYFEVRKLNPSK